MAARVSELIVGPFAGAAVYPRAARASFSAVLAALLAVVLLSGLGLGAAQYVRLGARVDSLESSRLWLMPRVRISEGLATVDGEPGRVVEDERFVVVFDTSDSPAVEPARPGDERPRYLVGRVGLVVFTPEQPYGSVMPWSTINRAAGDITVDGPGLVDGLRKLRPALSAFLGGAVASATLLGTLLWCLVLAWLYRVVSFRSLVLPGFGPLLRVGLVASLPPILLSALLNAVPAVPDAWVLLVLLGGTAALFLLGATRVRLEQEVAPAAAPEPDAPAS